MGDGGVRNEWGINTLRRDKTGVILGRADPEKEFELIEKLGEGLVSFPFFF
jgi:hypothetical protein